MNENNIVNVMIMEDEIVDHKHIMGLEFWCDGKIYFEDELFEGELITWELMWKK